MLSAGIESARRGHGFCLLEVLVATSVVVVALAALAQLFAVATQANHRARTTTVAAVLAQEKMEQLRALTWGVDALGLPVSDATTNTAVVPEAASGGTGLSPSPPGALGRNVEGYCDFVDRSGNVLGGGAKPPADAVFVRRWSVEPLPTNPNNTLILQVLVTSWRNRGAEDIATTVTRRPDEARVVSVKTRKAF